MQNSAPVAPHQRAGLIDALRGFAVLGIFLGNMLHFSGWFFLSDAKRAALAWSSWDSILHNLLAVFIDGKFYSLFSLLFGIGFAVLFARCEASGRSINRFFSRRMTVLLVIGLVHSVLIWFGDILTLYALVGYALLLFRKRSDRALLLSAAVLFALPVIQYLVMVVLHDPVPVNPAAAAQRDLFFAEIIRGLASGTTTEMLRLNFGGLIFGRYPDLLFTGRIFKVLATFLVGVYVGRNQIFFEPARWKPLLRRVAAWGVLVGLPANVALARLAAGDGFERLTMAGLAESMLYAVGVPSLAFGYAALFALLSLRYGRQLSVLEPVGRMALTNYLLQSVISILIFRTVGLGLMGTVSVTAGTVLVLVIFAAQIAISHLLVARFRFGPAEWLWRSLTYGKVQPMRKPATPFVAEAS